METRKVQLTGGSTFTVSLPKEWATAAGIEAGSTLEMYPEGAALVAVPKRPTDLASTTIEVTDRSSASVRSTVVALYVNGFDEIVLTSTEIEPATRRALRKCTAALLGLEVHVEESSRIVLRDYFDTSSLSVHDAVMRMRLLALTMVEDAMVALIANDDELAIDVVERDADVDRLWYVVSRLFRTALREPHSLTDVEISREQCFDYRSCARQFERIADHAVKIATHAQTLDEIPDSLTEPLRALESDAVAIVTDGMDAVLVDDYDRAVELATAAFERAATTDQRIRQIDEELREADPLQAQVLGLVADSLSRIGDYGMNVAETAQQSAAPTPALTDQTVVADRNGQGPRSGPR